MAETAEKKEKTLAEKYPDGIIYSNDPEAKKHGAGETPTCPFCGKQTPFLGSIMNDKVFWLRDMREPCDCVQAQAERWAAQKAAEEEAERERQREHREMVKRRQEYAGLEAREISRTFENYEETAENKRALNTAKRFVERVIDGTINKLPQNSLYIYGSYGTGKTHLAAAIANAAIEGGIRVVYTRFGELCRDVKRAYDKKAREDEDDILRKYKNCKLLVLDDLGKEKMTDWNLALLFELIDSRYRGMRPTVITANYSVEQTVDKLTANGADACAAGAIEDRLHEAYFQPSIGGESWRRRGRN